MIRRFLKLSARNLERNVKRNLATASAIVLGFVGIAILGGYVNRVDNFLRVHTIYVMHTGHIQIFPKEGLLKFSHKPKNYSFSRDDQKLIEDYISKDPNIAFFERQIHGSGLIGNGCKSVPFFANGFDPKIDAQVRAHPEVQKWLENMPFLLKGRGLWNYPGELGPIAVAKGLANALGKTNVHDDLDRNLKISLTDCSASDLNQELAKDANVQLLAGSWQGAMSAIDGEIVAQYTTGLAEADAAALMMSTQQLQRLYETNHLSQYAIWLNNQDQMPESVKALTNYFKQNQRDFDVYAWNDERLSPYYAGTLQFLKIMNVFIAIVLISIIILSVLNATTMTIIERSQEIGMYRSFGFRRSHVSLIFTLEYLWLSLGALLLGYIVAVTVVYLLNHAGIIYHPPGIAGGLTLKIVLKDSYTFVSALVILFLAVMTTRIGIYGRLRLIIANLLGGSHR